MAAASRDFPPEKPELCGYYFEIPKKAKVSRVQISTLSSSVRKRIMRLSGSTDLNEAPYVIVVSPIIEKNFPNGHKEAPTASAQSAGDLSSDRRPWTRNGHSSYFIPVKCLKDTALDILRLSQTSGEEEKWSLVRELANVNDSSIPNLEGTKMKATALCVYNNRMYLLPDSEERNMSGGGKKGEVQRPETNGSQSEAELRTNRKQKIPLKLLLPHQHCKVVGDEREKFAPAVKEWDKGKWEQAEETTSTNACPASSSSTKNSPQISSMECSKRRLKRKRSYDGNKETLTKRNDPSDSDTNQDSPGAQDIGGGSSPQSNSSSLWSLSPPGPQESPPRLSPASSSGDPEGPSASNQLCNILPPVAPAPGTPGPICGDDRSPPHPRATTSPSLSEFCPSSENCQELPETAFFIEPSLNDEDSYLSSLLNTDDSSSSRPWSFLSLLTSPQESPPRFSPAKSPSSADPEGPSASSLLCDVLLTVAPAPRTPGPINGDDRSSPHSNVMSSPSLSGFSPSSENKQELSERPSFSELSEYSKRKRSYDGNKEALTKRNDPSDSDTNQDSPVAQNIGGGSSPQSDSSSSWSLYSFWSSQKSPLHFSPAKSSSSADPEGPTVSGLLCDVLPPVTTAPRTLGLICGDDTSPPHANVTPSPSLLPFSPNSQNNQESAETPTFSEPSLMINDVRSDRSAFLGMDDRSPSWSLSPCRSQESSAAKSSSSADPEGPADSNEPCNILPPVTPAPLTRGSIGGDDRSPPHPRATSSPFWSEFPPTYENGQEPSETPSFSEPSLMTNDVRSGRSSLLDIDDTTNDERLQRLLNRVRECEKKVEDMKCAKEES